MSWRPESRRGHAPEVEERGGLPWMPAPLDAARLDHPDDATQVRSFVRERTSAMGLEGPRLDDFALAAHEVVINAMTHASIEAVRLWRARGRVICEVTDHGQGVVVEASTEAPQPGAVSGRGLWMARELTDHLETRNGIVGSAVRLHAVLPQAD